MSQILDVFKKRETNEDEVEKTLKALEEKAKKLTKQSSALKKKNCKLCHEKSLVEKQICTTESYNSKTENEILKLKTKTEESARLLELTQWKIYKTELLKELEKRRKDMVNQKRVYYEHLLKPSIDESNDSNEHCANTLNSNNTASSEVQLLQDKIENLKNEIATKRSSIQSTDCKLNLEIQTLEKRNNALKTRYQRQLREAENKLRQSLAELHSLQKLLADLLQNYSNNWSMVFLNWKGGVRCTVRILSNRDGFIFEDILLLRGLDFERKTKLGF